MSPPARPDSWTFALRRRAARLAVLATLGACTKTESRVAPLGLPPLDGARALVAVALSPDAPPQAEARALEGGELPSASFTFENADQASVYVFTYPYPLDLLGFAPGPVALGEGRPFPTAGAVFARSSGPGGDGAWATLDALPAEVATLKLASTLEEHCSRRFQFATPTILELPGEAPDTRVNVALALGDGSAFLATESNRIFRASPAGATPLADPQAELGPHYAGTLDPSGELWVLRRDALLRGHPDRTFLRVAPFTGTVRHLAWMQVASDGRVWISTDVGELWRFDGAVGTRLAQLPTEARGIVAFGDLQAVEDGMVVVPPIWVSCPDPFLCPVLEQAALPTEYWSGDTSTPLASPEAFVAVGAGRHPQFGAFVGSVRGDLYRLEARTWRPEYQLQVVDYIWDLIPDGEIAWLSAERGGLKPFHPAIGICPGVAFPPGHLSHVVPLGDGRLLLATEADFLRRIAGNRIIILERR